MIAEELRIRHELGGRHSGRSARDWDAAFEPHNNPGTTAACHRQRCWQFLNYLWLRNGLALTNGGKFPVHTTATLRIVRHAG